MFLLSAALATEVPMQLTVPAFALGAPIPPRHTCDAENVSPAADGTSQKSHLYPVVPAALDPLHYECGTRPAEVQ